MVPPVALLTPSLFGPFLSVRSTKLCSLTSAIGRATLRCRFIASPRPLQHLSLVFSETCASLKRIGRSDQELMQSRRSVSSAAG